MSQSIPSELAPRVELAYARIAGDPNLTGDLVDAEARVLLDWAQAEVGRLVKQTQGMEDEAAWAILDPKLSHLRKYLRRTVKVAAASEHPREMLEQMLASPTYPELSADPVPSMPEASASKCEPAPLARPSLFKRLFRKRGKQ